MAHTGHVAIISGAPIQGDWRLQLEYIAEGFGAGTEAGADAQALLDLSDVIAQQDRFPTEESEQYGDHLRRLLAACGFEHLPRR